MENNKQIVEFFLKSQVPAQKNQKVMAINRRTGKPFPMTSKSVAKWKSDANDLLDLLEIKGIAGPVEISLNFVHKDKRKRDIDNEVSTVLDLLKNRKIIEDDNCFVLRKIVAQFDGVSKENPGVYITIKPIDKTQTV